VSLSELIYRALVSFLQCGRYVSCLHIAQCYSYAESRALNALQHQTTAEDFAFDYGECSVFLCAVCFCPLRKVVSAARTCFQTSRYLA
jgi:hypothetical protein